MKNRLVKKAGIVLLAAAMVMGVAACGQKDTNTDGQAGTDAAATDTEKNETAKATGVSTKDYNPDDYVTLGDYEGLEVEVDTYNYTAEDVEQEMQSEFDYYIQNTQAYDYKKLDKDTVEDGDIVNIDYVGKKDGVAFDGGTAQGAHLTIGSGQFIDGFESGLIGHKVGETVSLNLTFPEQYHSEELAGQAVVFDVTINSIDEQSVPELNDEAVQKMGSGHNTVDEFKKSTEEYIAEKVAEQNEESKKAAVWEKVYGLCKVSDPPEAMVQDVLDRIASNLAAYANQYQVSEDDFLTIYMGTTREEYEVSSKENAVTSASEKLVAAAIAKKEGIEITDEVINEYASKDAEKYGYDSADAVIQQAGKESYYDYVLGQKVDDFLLTKVKIKEKEPVSIMSTLNN
ncbi:MAG: trigger factor [Lachnospiraceae bacterium]|nr:trigger factor [Lachnospiraceae bacterium]